MAAGWLKWLQNKRDPQSDPQSDSADIQGLFERAISLHQKGLLAEAKTIYDHVLGLHPGNFDALHMSGVIQYQRGQLEDAVELLEKAIGTNANQAPAHSNLGLALQKLARPQEALVSYDRALALKPDYAEAFFNRGNAFRDLKRFREAVASYDSAIDLRPDFTEAFNNRGLALGDLHRSEDALASFDQALAVKSNHVDALNNRGTTLCDLKRHEEALASFDSVIALRPDHPDGHNNRGAALGGLLRYEDALTSYRRALAIAPHFAEALYNSGAIQSSMRKHEEALTSYDRALSLRPEYPEALNARGTTLRNLTRYAEALASYDQALEIRPDFPEALDNRGVVLANLARHEEALASHDRALALRPEFPQALSNRATALREIGEQSAAMDSYRQAILADPNSLTTRFKFLMACVPVLAKDARDIGPSRARFLEEARLLEEWSSSHRSEDEHEAVGAMQPFHLAYQEENNRELLARYGTLCCNLMARWQKRNEIHVTTRFASDQERMRLGIVSAHLHNHSVWNAIVKGWLHTIDRHKFEIEVFHLSTKQDEQTEFARAHCDRFEDGDMDLADWAKAIRERALDVLIYPEVGMDVMTPRLASMRLAPVQIAAWGHPETTGLPTIDYYLSAECFETPNSQECYVEKLVPLPNLGCHYIPEGVAAVTRDLGELGIDPDSPVFICPGTPFKYAPRDDGVFVEIAQRLGKVQFVFFGFDPVPLLSKRLHARLAKSFEAANLDSSKFVVFVPWQTKGGFYALMRQADAFLDTIGFSGFNTAMQAIECGLPIVTREGRFMRGRFASAILKRMHLGDLVANSEEKYVELAVRLAQDRTFNMTVRERIRASRSILFRDSAPIEALENFLLGLWPDRAH